MPPEVKRRLAELYEKNGLVPGASVMNPPPAQPTAAEMVPEPVPKRRSGGRPKAGIDPIPWDEIRAAYCYGEAVVDDAGTPLHRYPSLAELERRFGVSRQSIRERQLREHWDDTREGASRQIQADTTKAVVAQVGVEKAAQVRQQALGALDRLIEGFADDVAKGRFKIRSMKDAEIALALRNKLGADQETSDDDGDVGLEAIARRRRELMEQDAGLAGLGEADANGVPKIVIGMEPDERGTYSPPARPQARKPAPPPSEDEGGEDA